MRIVTIGGSLIVLFTIGCSGPKITNSTELELVPGQGVVNVLSLGATFSQVKETVGELVGENRHRWSPASSNRQAYYSFGADLPQLGIKLIGWGNRPATVCQITAVVDPDMPGDRFFGSVNGLSFTHGRRVLREDVVQTFGEPIHDLGASPGYTNFAKITAGGESASAWFSEDREMICYPTNGVMFYLVSNVVRQVLINWKVEPANPPYSEPAARAPQG